ncbi:TPA: helix-turn-helix domain-containing protein [Bacillus cereus]|nr:helix-turn-helix domain-containing protein [Bacillus cereus]
MNTISENSNLVSIEAQTEYLITSGKRETRIFLKMYVDAVHSGLIADLGPERWTILCVLASFMDEDGECYPTQDMIAKRLNISHASANRRIKKLCEYRSDGRPLVVKERRRHERTLQWEKTVYTILPISQLAIFGNEPESISPCDA